jgi:hypothetical protein
LVEQVKQLAEGLEAARLELSENRRSLLRRQEDLVERRGRLTGVRERAAVLEQLEKTSEGIGRGAQEV